MIGFVYIMKNPSLREGFLKIGLTHDLKKRVKSLSGTSVPDDYELLSFYQVKDMRKTEDYIFSRLKSYRYKESKEFFLCGFKYAHEICLSTQKYVNNLNGPYSGTSFLSDEALDQLLLSYEDEIVFED